MSNAKKVKKNKAAKPNNLHRLKSLVDIGIALSSEKELDKFIELILEKSIEATGAEGASAYLIETNQENKNQILSLANGNSGKSMKFYRTTNRRSGFQEPQGILEVNDSSIAGYVALNNKLLNIEDCYDIAESEAYAFNDSFDEATGYKTKSILTIPMTTSQGKVRGVLQLINKMSTKGLSKLKKNNEFDPNETITFSEEDEELMKVFASQATVAVENTKLTDSIESLFESFVHASVKAIESRDPTTSGHSDRVAVMTLELAIATHKLQEGPYKFVKFSENQLRELRYAALLHDFGKIGVNESILLKQKKLTPRSLESILLRLDTLEKTEETKLWKNFSEALMEGVRKHTPVSQLDNIHGKVQVDIDTLKQRVRQLRSHIIKANEPYIVNKQESVDNMMTKLDEVSKSFGKQILSNDELTRLSIPRGSLTFDERKEIESHVSHTYEFLKEIAWTEDLSNLVEIAHCHHEKLDGTGYPRGLTSEQIPIQAKMMTIADIYDALTSFDRPYKEPLPPEKAIEIIEQDCIKQRVDYELLKIFVEAGVFLKVTGMSQRRTG